jgi:hypothetical protein
MTDRRILNIALKVLGVVCFIKAVGAMPRMSGWANWPSSPYMLSVVGTSAVLACAGWILVRYTDQISARLCPQETPVTLAENSPDERWYALFVAILGFGILVWKVPSGVLALLWTATQALGMGEEVTLAPGVLTRWAAILLSPIVNTALGLCLVFKSNEIGRWLFRLGSGTDGSEEVDSDIG